MTIDDVAELGVRFTHHPPTEDQADTYRALRRHGRDLATHIMEVCPESRERSLALTNIEQAIMWANAAIARRC